MPPLPVCHDKAMRTLRSYLQKVCLLSVLMTSLFLVFILITPHTVKADENLLPPEISSWLSALTYEEEDPADFGTETTAEDKALLNQFRPRIFIAPEGLMPVDFYRFYLPKTVVRDKTGVVVKKSPDRAYLKSIERRAGYYLDYEGEENPCVGNACKNYVAAGYGRVYRETARFKTKKGVRQGPVIIL